VNLLDAAESYRAEHAAEVGALVQYAAATLLDLRP
jgi:hypothetical protein